MAQKVKSILCYTAQFKRFNFNESPQREGEYKSALTVFDAHGNIVQEIKYGRDGAIEETIENVYDVRNKLIKESIEYAHDGVTETRVITRDDKGHVTEERKEYADGSFDRTEYKNNESGHVTEVIKYNEDDSIESKITLAYNDKNKLIEEKRFDGENDLVEHRQQTYNEAGNIIEIKEFSPEDGLAYTTFFAYNAAGKNTEISYYDAKGILVMKTVSEFDSKGNVVEKTIEDFASSSAKRINKYVYDDHNNCIEESVTSGSGKLLSSLSIRYDESGNPTEEITYDADLTEAGRDAYFGNRYTYEFFD